MHDFDALIVAAIQEPNDFDAHQRDIAQVQDLTRAAIAHYGPHEGNQLGPKPAAQLKCRSASFRALLNPQCFIHSPLSFAFLSRIVSSTCGYSSACISSTVPKPRALNGLADDDLLGLQQIAEGSAVLKTPQRR
jgi:hypothetical protein